MNKILALNPPFGKKLSLGLEKKVFLRVLVISSCILAILLLGLCVFQVIRVSAENYQVVNYEKKIKQLSRENKELQILLSQRSSLGDLEVMAEDLGFEPVDKIHYIEIFEGTVVRRQR